VNPPANLLDDYLDGALGAAESAALQHWLAEA